MDIFGIGGPELFAVLIVALLVLGPERMVDMARQTGKWWRDAQLMVRTLADAATTKLDEEVANKDNSPPRDPVPGPEDAVARGGGEEPSADEPIEAEAGAAANASTESPRTE